MGVEEIGNNILRLRRRKGVTQEVLAAFIGVSKTSVSKWETGATMPDIQMLPLLASYFEVSVDELISYVPALNREQIRFHYQRLAEAFAAGPFGKVLTECREMSRKYYSCYPFLQQLVVLLLNHVGTAEEAAEREEAVELALDLCGHILGDCQDVDICKNVISLKGMLNLMRGRADLVLEELGEDFLRAEHTEETGALLTMAYLMTGNSERAKTAAQIGMYRSLMGLVEYGILLLEAGGEESSCHAQLLERMDGVMEAFKMQELSPNAAAKYEYQVAAYLAGKLEKESEEIEEEIFRRLESYGAACCQLFADGIRLHGDAFFSSLDDWFEELELGTAPVRSSESVRESVLQGFQNPVFSVLKDQERLQELKQQFVH